MENISELVKEDDQMDLPPGFRFHPTDEELISHYLYKKVLDINFSSRAIGDVDLNKSEPWELPCKLVRSIVSFSFSILCKETIMNWITFSCYLLFDFVWLKGKRKWE